MTNHRTAAFILLIASLLMVVALSSADDRKVIVLPPAQIADANNINAHGQDANVTAAADPECDTCGEAKAPPPPPCGDCDEPKTPEPPCNCEEPKEAEMTCNKVHAVQDGETCDSVVQCAGLEQDDFLRFNPNLCCDKLFVGQWVCLEACDA